MISTAKTNILVTGAKGFIGKNLIAELKNQNYQNIHAFDIDTDPDLLDDYCLKADFVFHLAGVNRPEKKSEFMEGNFGFTSTLLEKLKKFENACPVMISSSIQAELDNPYGLSKKAGEDLILRYGEETGASILIYRFPNVFGKWSRPNYNSAIATFCFNISRDIPITVNDPDTVINLVYIDDVIEELVRALRGQENRSGRFCSVPISYTINLGEIVGLFCSFKEGRKNLLIPDVADPLTRKLYSTYLSFLPDDQLDYELKMNVDSRGSFTEFLKASNSGQVSVNVSKPGITKGNHWHHSKVEKFLVVYGEGIIRFRRLDSDEILEYRVDGSRLTVVDIPPGYTHNIENLGETDLVTIMWANEPFDPVKPDTYYLEV